MSLLHLFLVLTAATGTVRDASTQQPVAGALVQVVGTQRATLTDSIGRFEIDAVLGDRVRFSRAGFALRELQLNSLDGILIHLTPSVRSLEGVTVTAMRGAGAASGAPIAQRVVTQQEIESQYSGQELPNILMVTTPSMTTYSDGGAYSNYTYLRIRGIDQSRVNVTLDGVPLNDAEDQGVFFSNFPDFGNSLQSIQIQRGVGTSTQGIASYAGSINLESIALSSALRGGEVQVTGGSFGTRRASAEWQSGLMPNRFSFYSRVSASETDGFRRNAGNTSHGGFFSAGYFAERTSVKATLLSGISRNGLAYLASDIATLSSDPRDNPLPPVDRDRFRQSVGSAALTHLVGNRSSLTATAYVVEAGGNYDVTFDGATSNYKLASAMYGLLGGFNTQAGAVALNFGAHGNTYARDHASAVRPDVGRELYRNSGEKDEVSAFAKATVGQGPLQLFADLQVRRAFFRYNPAQSSGISGSSIGWTFVNPKLGATWALQPTTRVFASWGTNGREPTRNDMFAGFDDVDSTNVDFIGSFSRVRPERVHDFEAGIEHTADRVTVSANLFEMRFRNEITPIGALSYIGLPLRKNVDRSLRRGFELDATYRAPHNVLVTANASVMRGRIDEYTDDATQETFRDVTPLLTPGFTSNQSVSVPVQRWGSITLSGRYVGRSFLANTGDERFVTPPGYLTDLATTFQTGPATVLVQLRNAFDRRFYNAGFTDGSTSYYYIHPPRNLTVTTRWAFGRGGR